MNLHVFCIHISIMLLLQYALAKTLPESDQIDSEVEEIDNSGETEAIHEAHPHSIKHTKASHMSSHKRKRRAFDDGMQCAVMYKNDEPIGILQPFQDSYKLLPIHSDESIPVVISPLETETTNKRDTASETKQSESENEILDNHEADSASFWDEKYPSIFARFKIESKVEKDANQKTNRIMMKRESNKAPLFSEKHVNSLRSTLSRLETNEDGAEVDLKNILSDMGLIEDSHIDKREADESDQSSTSDKDLEQSSESDTNKEQNDNDNPIHERVSQHRKHAKVATEHYGILSFPEPKSVNEKEIIDTYINHHPEQFKQNVKSEREKRSQEVAAEMEKQIKERLQKIKEEVRREIEEIKGNTNEDSEDYGEGEEEESKSQRKKRNAVSSLMDEETSDIDPVLFGENNLAPHIRRRRSLGTEDNSPDSNFENTKKVKSEEKKKIALSLLGKPADNKIESNLIANDNGGRKRQISRRSSKNTHYLNEPIEKNTYINGNSQTEAPNMNQHFATTGDHFILRKLHEYTGESNNENYDDIDDEYESDDENPNTKDTKNREKKACKCIGKDCKCGRPKPLIGEDGSNFVYFDGAPMLASAPFTGPLKKVRPSNRNAKKRTQRQNKRSEALKDGAYTLDIDPDIYKLTGEDSNSFETRKKRNTFIDLVALHGGGPTLNHLIAIRKRSMLPKLRVKRSSFDDQTERGLFLADMSGEDLFGALPESYEGEQARYKRVKRD